MQTSTLAPSIKITWVLCFPSVLWPVPAACLFWSSSVLLSAAILLCLDVAQRALSETRGWEWDVRPSQGVPAVGCQPH